MIHTKRERYGLKLPEYEYLVGLLDPFFDDSNWKYVHFYPESKQVVLDDHYNLQELLVLVQILQQLEDTQNNSH